MAFQRPDSRRPRRDGGNERPKSNDFKGPRRDDRGAPSGPRTPGGRPGGFRPDRDAPRDRGARPSGGGFRPDRDNRDARPGGFRPDRDNRDARPGGFRPDRDNRDARPGGFRPDRDNRDARPGGFRPDREAPRGGSRDFPRRDDRSGGGRPDRDRDERPRHFDSEGERPERPARTFGTPSHSADGSIVPHGERGERNRKFSKPESRPEGGDRRFGQDRPRFDADRPQRFERDNRDSREGRDNRSDRPFNRDDRRPGRFEAKPNGNRGFGSDRRDPRERHQDNRARDERRANTGGWEPEHRFRPENDSRGSFDRDRDQRPDRRPGERSGDRSERPARGGFAGGERGPRRPDDNRFGQGRMKQQEAPNYNLQRYEKHPARKQRNDEDNEPKEGIRLNRYIANSGVCSRREADNLIAAGEIRVNGEVVKEMGYIVKANDTVQYGKRSLKREKLVYVLLNKPKDYITTTEDPEERKTVMDLVANSSKERIFPVGRLDRNTTGLLLFTNDGEMAQKLTHPSHRMQKIYQVEIDKALKPEDFQAIRDGLELEDGKVEVDDIAVVGGNERFVGIELHSGRNRIVRRIFEHLGYDVVALDRVQYAGLTKKDLPRGNWRYLTQQEVVRLKFFL